MKTEHIHLRALEPEDISYLYKWENDPLVWNVSNTIVPFSKYILKRYIENSHLDIFETKQQRFMMIHTETNLPIGTIDLFEYDPRNRRVGVGILIYNESERRRGYASEGLSIVVRYCFRVLDVHQIFCNITTDNQASVKLFEKHGFNVSGVKKDWLRIGGRWCDELLLQLINPDM